MRLLVFRNNTSLSPTRVRLEQNLYWYALDGTVYLAQHALRSDSTSTTSFKGYEKRVYIHS
jgi:hypothetical protein